MTQRTIEILSPFFINLDATDAPADWQAIFGNSNPMVLEIGCGIGHFIVDMAQRHPEKNFLAIDIYNKGCYKTCRKVELNSLTNVRVARTEARHLFAHHFERGHLSAVHINCPDPWPKKRHRKRRLVQADFLESARYYLMPDGDFFFCSDVADYAEDVSLLLSDLPGLNNQLPRPLLNRLDGYPVSKYMRRFIDQGKPLHFLHYRKDPLFKDAPRPRTPDKLTRLWKDTANG